MDSFEVLYSCIGFQWDRGNAEKNWIKHRVGPTECEQVFFNLPLIIAEDVEHSQRELRYFALGKTDVNRMLFLVFTVRKNLIRIISARNMSKNERKVYISHEKGNT